MGYVSIWYFLTISMELPSPISALVLGPGIYRGWTEVAAEMYSRFCPLKRDDSDDEECFFPKKHVCCLLLELFFWERCAWEDVKNPPKNLNLSSSEFGQS